MKISLSLIELLYLDDCFTLYTGEEHVLTLRPSEATAKVSADMSLIKKVADGAVALYDAGENAKEAIIDFEYLELLLLREVADSKVQFGADRQFGTRLKMKVLKAIRGGFEQLTDDRIDEDVETIIKSVGMEAVMEDDEPEKSEEVMKQFKEKYDATKDEDNSKGDTKAKRKPRARKTL